MGNDLIDLRTLPEGTLCEATGPLRTILGPLLGPLAALYQGVQFRVITPDDGTKDYPCGVKLTDSNPALAWLEAMQPAKVLSFPTTTDAGG